MKSIARLVLLLTCCAPLWAQAQLKPAPAPTATRAVSLPPPSKPQAEDKSQTAENTRLRERLQQPALPAKPATPVKPATPALARPVYDRNGQLAPQMQQTSPGRVIDSRTGKYYDTVPSGVGQQVVPPPSAARGN
jgi:hypothetical protein